jgi:nucleoside phosphorylase
VNADVAQVVVLSALELEYEEVRAQVSELRLAQHDAGTVFEIGALPGRAGTVAIAVTGPGIQAAAVVTERAIATFRPRAVLFVGIAGALHSDLELGDVVVATKIYDYQGGAEDAEGFRARPQSWEAPHRLEQLARHVSRAWSGVPAAGELEQRPARVHFRPIATGAVVLNSRDAPLARQLHHSYSDAAAIEMESAGTAKAAHLNQAQTLTIRGVSDKADGAKLEADRAGWQQVAAANAAGFAIAVAAEILRDRGRNDTSGSEPARRSPRHPRRRRGIGVVLLVAIGIVTAVVTAIVLHSGRPRTPQKPGITVSSGAGPLGTSVRLDGQGFLAGDSISLFFFPAGGAEVCDASIFQPGREAYLRNTAVGDGQGRFSAALTLPREVDQKTTGPFVFCAADREAERYAAASYAAGPVTPAPSTSSGTPSDTAPGAKLRQDRISLRAEDNAYLEEGMAGTAVPYSDLYFPTASGSELQLAPQGDAVMAAVPDQPGYPECRRAVQARHDGFVMAKPGSWLCVRTNHGNIAAVQILSVTAVPQSILLGVTVWHR